MLDRVEGLYFLHCAVSLSQDGQDKICPSWSSFCVAMLPRINLCYNQCASLFYACICAKTAALNE